jgi:hypothetical protein
VFGWICWRLIHDLAIPQWNDLVKRKKTAPSGFPGRTAYH